MPSSNSYLGIDAKPRKNIRKIRMNKYRYYFIFIEVGFLLVLFFKINNASVFTKIFHSPEAKKSEIA